MDCDVCGNEITACCEHCPYCGAEVEKKHVHSHMRHRVVNLERGMPLVSQALQRMDQEILLSKSVHCQVITFIHGYGSSGKGGAIKQEARARLEFMVTTGAINSFLAGEDFSSRSGKGRHLLRRFPFLLQHRDLNRSNRGITLVIL